MGRTCGEKRLWRWTIRVCATELPLGCPAAGSSQTTTGDSFSSERFGRCVPVNPMLPDTLAPCTNETDSSNPVLNAVLNAVLKEIGQRQIIAIVDFIRTLFDLRALLQRFQAYDDVRTQTVHEIAGIGEILLYIAVEHAACGIVLNTGEKVEGQTGSQRRRDLAPGAVAVNCSNAIPRQ